MDSSTVNLPEGYTLDQAPNPSMNLPEGYTLDQENAPEMGGLESFGRGLESAAKPLATGITSLVEGKPFSQEANELENKYNQAWEQSPIAYGAGKATGIAGEAALAPEVLPEAALGTVGANVAQNAGISALNANWAKPTEALEETATGGALGGLGGYAAGKIGEQLPKMADTAEARLGAQALDLNTFGIKRLQKESPNLSHAAVVNDLLDRVEKVMPDVLDNPLYTANDKFSKVLNYQEQASNTIGKFINTIDEANPDFKALSSSDEINELLKDLNDQAKDYIGVQTETPIILKKVAEQIKALQDSGNLSFKTLYDIKKNVGAAYHNPLSIPAGTDEVYGAISNAISKLSEKLSNSPNLLKEYGNGITPQDFKTAQKTFSLTKDLLPAMARISAREVAGSPGMGSSGLIGLGSLATGHPMGVLAAVGKSIQEMAFPDFGKNVAYQTFKQGKKALPYIKQALPIVGKEAVQGASDVLNNHFSKGGEIDPLLEHYKNQLDNIQEVEKPKIKDNFNEENSTPTWNINVNAEKDPLIEHYKKNFADGGIADLNLINEQENDEPHPDSAAQDQGMQDATVSDFLAPYLMAGGAKGISSAAQGIGDLASKLGEKGIISLGGRIVSTPEEIANTLNQFGEQAADNFVKGAPDEARAANQFIDLGSGNKLRYEGQIGMPEHGIPNQHYYTLLSKNPVESGETFGTSDIPYGGTNSVNTLAQKLGDKINTDTIPLEKLQSEVPTNRVQDMLANDADWSAKKNFGNTPKVDLSKDVTLPNAGMNALTTDEEKEALLNWLKKEYGQE